MGSNRRNDRRAGDDEQPQHVLDVTDYHIMRYSVTNEQYAAFVSATGRRPPQGWSGGTYLPELAGHPVTWVNLLDAVAFSRWAAEQLGLPVRLPTEPEWEKAARGPDGRLYPWGNEWEADRCSNREAKARGTNAVAAFSPAGDSPYGAGEMAGNVQNWCISLFGPYPYTSDDGREQLLAVTGDVSTMPQFHESGATSNPESMEASLGKQVMRGGSWRGTRDQARCAYRSWAAPMHRSDDTGFRCAWSEL